jgi:hypothetical protein
LWSRTLELLNRGGGAEPFVNAGFKAKAVNFAAGGKVIGRVSMELMLPQSETERLIEEKLARLGVAIERRVELAGFQRSSDGFEATLRHAAGVTKLSRQIGCLAATGLTARCAMVSARLLRGDSE